MNKNTAIPVIALIVASVSVAVAFATLPRQPLPACAATPTATSFNIIITSQGFNNSKTHTDPWPCLKVVKGQTISIHIENQDPTEPHGFAITHYLDSGIKLGPGQSDNISFTANQAGTFLVYCNILCTIHLYMLSGQLNVTT